MANYVLSCCSTADLTKEHFQQRDISYICFHYQLDGVDYPDDLGESMPFDKFYAAMANGADTRTSQVNISEFVDYFTPFLEQGKDILHVCLSSGLSGVSNSAENAARIVRERYPERKIYIVDSLGASSGYGLLMDKLADLRDEGMGIDAVRDWAEAHKLELHHWFFSTDLTFYVRGGRISKVAGVFGGLLESARMTDRKAENFQTSDVYEYLNFLRSCVRGDMFDHDSYQRDYVATAVQMDDWKYNGDMLKYVKQLRASGTYENDSALARYYYLPRQEWSELFDCSLEGIHQVRSSPDGWNYQMDFYREEVLPAMGADNVSAFVDGVLSLGEALDAMNGEGRLETVGLNETNQSFLTLCRSVKEQGISGQDAYTVLSLMVQSGEEEAEDSAQ